MPHDKSATPAPQDDREARAEPTPADDQLTRAFIDGWNATLDHTDFDMALHFWMRDGCGIPSPRYDRATAFADQERAPGVDEALEWIVEDRARRICQSFKIDPDEITDPYGPVRQWDAAAYHINETIAALAATPAAVAEDVREQIARIIDPNAFDAFGRPLAMPRAVSALAKADAILALNRPSTMPEGFVMVPREPTPDMVEAARGDFVSSPGKITIKAIWSAMIASAPAAPVSTTKEPDE